MIKIVLLPTRDILNEYELEHVLPLFDEWEVSPRTILAYIVSVWISFELEPHRLFYSDLSLIDQIEIHVVEDLIFNNKSKASTVKEMLAVVRIMIRQFFTDILPAIESLELNDVQLSQLDVRWHGKNLSLNIRE